MEVHPARAWWRLGSRDLRWVLSRERCGIHVGSHRCRELRRADLVDSDGLVRAEIAWSRAGMARRRRGVRIEFGCRRNAGRWPAALQCFQASGDSMAMFRQSNNARPGNIGTATVAFPRFAGRCSPSNTEPNAGAGEGRVIGQTRARDHRCFLPRELKAEQQPLEIEIAAGLRTSGAAE